MDLVGTTSRTSFTRPTTFGKRHHSPPYSILCTFLFIPHPNVTFSQDSQVKVPKLGLLMSQTFGCLYLSQIKFISKIQEQYLVALENIFPMVYTKFQSDLIWTLLSRDLWSGVKLGIWLLPLLFIITHANQVLMNNLIAIEASMLQDLYNGVLGAQFSVCLPFQPRP